MSTSYYRLMAGITSVRLDDCVRHDHVTVWEHGACSGYLTFTAGYGATFCRALAEELAMTSSYGGALEGTIVVEHVSDLQSDTVLVGENGIPITVAEVRAKRGQGKREEIATEGS